MNKKQVIVALILTVILGAVFESFKKVSFKAQSGDGGISALLSDLDIKPFAQNFRKGKLGKTQKVNRRARAQIRKRPRADEPMKTFEQLADNQREQLSFNENPEGQRVAENTKEKKKKTSEEDDKEDSKDGDKADNPDGEENSDEKEVAELEDQLEKDEQDKNEDTDENDAPVAEAEPFSGGGPVSPQLEEDEAKPLNETLAEWADQLLKFPDYKLMNEFIALKQAGQISDEVFYPIITMMLEDSREPMKVLGAHGLGATPSAKSFELIIVTKTAAPFGSRLSEDLSRYTQAYTNIQYLSALRDVLYSSEDIEVLRTAAVLVDQAAMNYLPEPQTSPEEGDITTLEVRRKRQRDVFQGFVSILHSLAQSFSDQSVTTAASQAYDHIIKYIPQDSDDVNVVSNSPDTTTY